MSTSHAKRDESIYFTISNCSIPLLLVNYLGGLYQTPSCATKLRDSCRSKSRDGKHSKSAFGSQVQERNEVALLLPFDLAWENFVEMVNDEQALRPFIIKLEGVPDTSKRSSLGAELRITSKARGKTANLSCLKTCTL